MMNADVANKLAGLAITFVAGAALAGCAYGSGPGSDGSEGQGITLGGDTGGIGNITLPPPKTGGGVETVGGTNGQPADAPFYTFGHSLNDTVTEGILNSPASCDASSPFSGQFFENDVFVTDLEKWGCLGMDPVEPNPNQPGYWWMVTMCPNARSTQSAPEWAYESINSGVFGRTMDLTTAPMACTTIGTAPNAFQICDGGLYEALGTTPLNPAGDVNASPASSLLGVRTQVGTVRGIPIFFTPLLLNVNSISDLAGDFKATSPYFATIVQTLYDCNGTVAQPAPTGWSYLYFDPACASGKCTVASPTPH